MKGIGEMEIVDLYAAACVKLRAAIEERKAFREKILSGQVPLIGQHYEATVHQRVTIKPRAQESVVPLNRWQTL